MTHPRPSHLALMLTAAAMLSACHRGPTMLATSLPVIPRQHATAPPPARDSIAGLAPAVHGDTAQEARVTIDTHGRAEDVRPLLDFVAARAGISLIYASNIDKKVRASLTDVPVATALKALLASAGLTLESPEGGSRVPATPSVVFYQLPVNVDSLSVDAIMKRFGVGRAVAELIVQARVKP